METGLYISHNLSLSRLSVNTYFYLKVFLFGATVTGLLTSVGKLTIGRLRPHFISVCGPDMEFTEASCGSQENPRYITHFTCTGQDQDKIQDARSVFSSPSILIKHYIFSRLSFPSGHSSAAFYSAVFTILYLGIRTSSRCFSLVLMNQVTKRSGVTSQFISCLTCQICLLTYAWYCALTRVSDYKHHPSDVLAGGLLGLTMAAFFASFLRRSSHEAEDKEEDRDRDIEKSRSDLLLQDDRL